MQKQKLFSSQVFRNCYNDTEDAFDAENNNQPPGVACGKNPPTPNANGSASVEEHWLPSKVQTLAESLTLSRICPQYANFVPLM